MKRPVPELCHPVDIEAPWREGRTPLDSPDGGFIGVDLAVHNIGGHSSNEHHNYFAIQRKRGYGIRRNPLVILVGRVGFEPTTS